MPLCQIGSTFANCWACLRDIKTITLCTPTGWNVSGNTSKFECREKSFSCSLGVITCLSPWLLFRAGLDLWLLPIATLWLSHQEKILIFSRLQMESVSVNHVSATSLILTLSLCSAPRHFNSLSIVHSWQWKYSLCPLACVSRLLTDGRLWLRWQHCATEAAYSGCSLIHCCSGQSSQGRRLRMWRWVPPNIENNFMNFVRSARKQLTLCLSTFITFCAYNTICYHECIWFWSCPVVLAGKMNVMSNLDLHS